MKKCKIIGLTGQSGAGKSTVAKYFENNNINVINADEIVKKIYSADSVCLKAVCSAFGNDIIKDDNSLDRKLLAKRAFASKSDTELLNSIVHPFVMAEFLKKTKEAINQGAKYIIYDAPQLFESNADIVCDYIVSVVADEVVRIERICKRDNLTKELAKMRVNAQLSEDFFKEQSDYIIENNSDVDALQEQINLLIKDLFK